MSLNPLPQDAQRGRHQFRSRGRLKRESRGKAPRREPVPVPQEAPGFFSALFHAQRLGTRTGCATRNNRTFCPSLPTQPRVEKKKGVGGNRLPPKASLQSYEAGQLPAGWLAGLASPLLLLSHTQPPSPQWTPLRLSPI